MKKLVLTTIAIAGSVFAASSLAGNFTNEEYVEKFKERWAVCKSVDDLASVEVSSVGAPDNKGTEDVEFSLTWNAGREGDIWTLGIMSDGSTDNVLHRASPKDRVRCL